MLNIRQSLKFSFFLVFAFLLISIQKVNAAAIACNANEIAQTFSFSGTNTWPSGTTSKSFNVGTAPNAVTLTFTHTQAAGVTPITGDPQLQSPLGNVNNTLAVSSNGGYAGGTLLSTFSLATPAARPINKLSFTIMDEDSYSSGGYLFYDRTVSTTNAGTTTAITPQVAANQTINVGTGTATAKTAANCNDNDNSCNIDLEFNRTGITSQTTQFIAAHTGTSTGQRIGFNTYAWCLPKMPTVKVQKITTGHTGAGGTFTFADTNLTGTIASISTTAPSTATPASPTALPATTINTDVTITETPASGFALSSATCTDANSGSTGNPASFGSLAGNVLTIPATNMRAGADITCTFTNRKTAQLTLRKTWTNAKVNDAVTVTTAGGTVNPAFASVANSANETDTGTATTVFAGETLTFTEPFSVGSAANYNASLSCTGATDTNLANGLTINAADSNIVCTYTNSRKTANLTARKTWTNAKINDAVNITTTGGINNVNFNATANTVSETDTATAITVYAGDALTFAESFTTGTSSNYNSSLACTGATDTNLADGLTINAADSNIVCTYTNSRIAQSVRVNKQWTNSVTGHTATVTTTGGTNNPSFSSIAPVNTTGTAVTVYAGDVVTLPAETFGGGGTAIGYNTTVACTGGSTLASGAVGRTLTITNSATATVCTYNNTKLPTITITKISNGGVRAFDFTGSNGFANQTITTVSSGVGVAGATQRLTAAGVSTTITETVPYGYALTNVACTGLGTGTATVNYATATVTLNAAATAAANSIACTFTNTAYGTTPSDTLLKTTRFSAVPDLPTIIRGFSGTQNIVITNHGPDNATGVVAYYRPLVATGVSVTAVSSPSGACSFSSPDWVCPPVASVLNGGSFNVTVTYSTTNAASLGTAQQGEIRINSNEYTECGGVNEYKYNVWGLGGNTQPQPAPTNSAFWVGNTNTTTTATPSGAYSSESSDIFQAWPTTQDSPTGSYLYSPVAGRANNIYSPSSTTANPTVSKVLTGLNGQPENNVLLPQFGSTGTFTGDNKRAWEGQTCVYVPVATTITPCLTMFDDAAYISVHNISTGVTTVAAGQSSWNPGSVLSGNVSASPGYYIIKARIANRNTNGTNSEDAQGGYGQLAGIGSSTCSTAALDTLAQNAVPESINIIAPTTLQIAKAWGANSSASDSAIVAATTGGANNTTSFTTSGGTAANSGTPVVVAVGNTITFPAETGTNIGNYNTVLSCLADSGATANTLSGTNGQVSNTLVIGAGDLSKAIVCTYTNTRKSATLRIAKAWGANSITGNVANIGVTTGLTNNTSALTSTASTNINGTAVTVFAGEVATLPAETMSTGSLANYNTVLSCDNGITPSGSNGQASNTVTIPNTVSGLITCTYTNTRKSATLRIAKAWGANSITGNVANIGVTTGLTNNTSALTSTASTNTNGTAVTVFAGETVTLPAETMSTGTLSNYNTLLSCTADAGATANSLSGTNGQSSNTLTIGAGDEGKVVTCTYTNTGLSDMVPSLTYMPNTGIVGSPYYGKFSCTNSGIAPASAGATCAITLPAGLSATCSPTVPTASTVAVNATINCTVTGTPTTAVSDTLVLTTGATNDSNGGTTNGGNNQVTQAITITDPTATAMCSSGSATNLLSAAGTEVYYDTNTNTPITNSFGLIASPTTYVRTGSNFVVKGNWRWRNANPASGSPVMTYQLIVNGTAYAQLVGTPSGQEVGTLTALNGATLDGGLSTMQLYDFSVSGLAALPVSVTLPSTVTTISTLSMSFVSSTTPADDAGLAPTLLNACALPKLTITKVSNGGVGGFSFTGNNGFTNETITTTVAGTGVVGTTQTLSAVSTTTIISETIPSGYTVTDISCTGLGSGSATPNLATGTVTLSDTAVVYGANLACTFTNTATITNYILSGKVFLDNGKNAAIPHNGVLEADETGLGNITVQLTDCAATVHQSAVTNGAGAYSLAIPNGLLAGASVCVVEQPSSNLISVSGVAGTTGGAYSLAQDRTQFTLSAATNYTGVDFGNVVDSQLTSTGSQTIAAGTTTSYSHQFISGTEGLVTFSTAQAPTPALTWTSLVYIDTNCNALLDGGDTQVTAPVAVLADQVLCLLQKVQSPSTAANGSQDVSTISASFAFSAPSAITRLYSQDDTTIIMDSGLVLVKKVRSVSSCPSTGADVNPFVTNNQALPNSLIEYQITYSNPSSGVVSDVVINDMTPSFTTFRSASCASTPSSVLCSVGTSPTLGATGAISWPLANNPTGLTSGQSGDVRFCVRVDQ